jgi:DNA repair protein RadD
VLVVTFCNLLIEGVDVPEIGAIIVLRASQPLSPFLQVGGRGLRPVYAPGMPLDTVEQRFAAMDAGPKGRKCYILDHANCTFSHGFLDEDRVWSLDGRKKAKRNKGDPEPELKVRQCPKCYEVHPFAPSCPGCGHEYHVPAPLPSVGAGVLEEITEEMKAARDRDARLKAQAAARTIDGLVALGHSPAAAAHIVSAREQKQDLISDVLSKLAAWANENKGNILTQFGVRFSEVRRMKPKAIRSLLAQLDDMALQASLAGTEQSSAIPGGDLFENEWAKTGLEAG